MVQLLCVGDDKTRAGVARRRDDLSGTRQGVPRLRDVCWRWTLLLFDRGSRACGNYGAMLAFYAKQKSDACGALPEEHGTGVQADRDSRPANDTARPSPAKQAWNRRCINVRRERDVLTLIAPMLVRQHAGPRGGRDGPAAAISRRLKDIRDGRSHRVVEPGDDTRTG